MDLYGPRPPPSTSSSSSSSSSLISASVSDHHSCFRIDDLLDFTNHIDNITDHVSNDIIDPPFNIDPHLHHSDFNNNVADLCLPSDDVAELEWLSRFVGGEDDSSSFYDDSIRLPISGGSSGPGTSSAAAAKNDASFPGRASARSKRSRAATISWASEAGAATASRPRRAEEPSVAVRRCAHCLSEKTPQWRTGPMGPKTLCNACGVRFKSGRLVPEYRPAASPTFVLTQHSNSHRKVMELRRQKELSLLTRHRHRHQQQGQPAAEQDQLHSHHGFRVC